MKKRSLMAVLAAIVLIAAFMLQASPRAAAQGEVITDDNLSEAIANAKTPQQHEAIAAYYEKEAAANEAKAQLHRFAASKYKAFKSMKPVGMENHCDALAKLFQKAADEDKALAAEHREMAKQAAQSKG